MQPLTYSRGGSMSPSLSGDFVAAYASIQGRLLKSTSYSTVERYERSLTELLNHPDKLGAPGKIASAAYGNAGKVVRSRMRINTSYDGNQHDVADENGVADYSRAEWADFADATLANARERLACRLLLDGADAEIIARRLHISEGNANVLVSRIRKANRVAAVVSGLRY
jgi:hypothetical protein